MVAGFAPALSAGLALSALVVSDFAACEASAFLGSGLALPLLSTEMVSDDFSLSADFAGAVGFGVSGFFTIGPLQFAVMPKTALGAGSYFERD